MAEPLRTELDKSPLIHTLADRLRATQPGGVVLVTLSFEFAIVSLIPLATELVPEARASLLSLNMTAFSLGRILGAVIGSWLWQGQAGAIALNAVAGAVCALLATLLMLLGMVELK